MTSEAVQTAMEERINRELSGKQPSEISDLLLDNCKATTITGLTEEFNNLQTLSLINVGLTSLDGLPKLLSLRTIDLSDNKISGGFEKLVECCPRLYHINLCANKISDVETLAPLKNLQELAALDLFDCAVTEGPEYRTKVFALIPHLKYLDGFDINDVEADLSEEDEGAEGLGDEEDSVGDEFVDSDEEAELAYLNSSEALRDEDESEDYMEQPNAKVTTTNGQNLNGANKMPETVHTAENTRKRKLEEAVGGGENVEGEKKVKE